MNKIIIIGNIVRDPESASTTSGRSVSRFSVAVNREYEGADGTRGVDYFDVVTWNGLADSCNKYLQKGNKVCVTGPMRIDDYTTQSGEKRRRYSINADQVEFLSARKEDLKEKPMKAKLKEEKPMKATLKEVDADDFPF